MSGLLQWPSNCCCTCVVSVPAGTSTFQVHMHCWPLSMALVWWPPTHWLPCHLSAACGPVQIWLDSYHLVRHWQRYHGHTFLLCVTSGNHDVGCGSMLRLVELPGISTLYWIHSQLHSNKDNIAQLLQTILPVYNPVSTAVYLCACAVQAQRKCPKLTLLLSALCVPTLQQWAPTQAWPS